MARWSVIARMRWPRRVAGRRCGWCMGGASMTVDFGRPEQHRPNDSIRRLWPLVGSADEPGPLRPDPFTPMTGRPAANFLLAVNYYFGEYGRGASSGKCNGALVFGDVVGGDWRRTLLLPYFDGQYERSAGPLGLIVAVVWAVHPLATEAVVYITQRTELLVAFFYLATLYASQRYWAAGQRVDDTSSTGDQSWPEARRHGRGSC